MSPLFQSEEIGRSVARSHVNAYHQRQWNGDELVAVECCIVRSKLGSLPTGLMFGRQQRNCLAELEEAECNRNYTSALLPREALDFT